MKTLKSGKDVVERWFSDVFSNGDTNAVEELLSTNVVFHAQGHQKSLQGRDEFLKWLDWYLETFDDNEWDVQDIIQEGNKIVARYKSQAVYKGGLMDVKGDNQKIKETGILIFYINNKRKIKEIWCEMSDLQVLQQLGALSES